jgi:hypothetical protein
MNSEEIKKAFFKRELLDQNDQTFNFEDLACSVVSLRDQDMLNYIPSLMIHVLKNKQNKRAINYAEMIVFCLMPQPKGWSNIIDSMDIAEVSVTLKWLLDIKDCSFVENCTEELQLAIDLFRTRLNSSNW